MKEYGFCSEEAFLKRLGEYVMIETPSRNADQIRKLDALLEQDLQAIGAVITQHPASRGTVLQAEVGEGDRRVLLLGHKDTVFPLGTYDQNPYREEIQEGERVLRGPGVLDMKSGVLMTVQLLRHFASHPIPGVRITAVFNCDEEIGSGESAPLIRRLCRESEFCLCLEPSIPGYCTVARKGLLPYRLTAHGIAAHSGVNYQKGASAIEGLCRVIARIYDLRDDERDLSINIGWIEAIGKNNIVCDLAEAKGELRCFEPELIRETIGKIESICKSCEVPGVRVDFEITGGRPAMKQTERSMQLYEIARECAKEQGLSLFKRASGGGSDGSFAADEGIPVVDGLGAEGDGAHTETEYVKVESIYPRLKMCADTIVKAIESEIGGTRR